MLRWRYNVINNVNRTECSPIRSVIVRVVNEKRRLRSRSQICLITCVITNRIGRHEVLLPSNHNHDNFRQQMDVTKKIIRTRGKKKSPILTVAIETVILIVIGGFGGEFLM